MVTQCDLNHVVDECKILIWLAVCTMTFFVSSVVNSYFCSLGICCYIALLFLFICILLWLIH